jgi:hypothetical protein
MLCIESINLVRLKQYDFDNFFCDNYHKYEKHGQNEFTVELFCYMFRHISLMQLFYKD